MSAACIYGGECDGCMKCRDGCRSEPCTDFSDEEEEEGGAAN